MISGGYDQFDGLSIGDLYLGLSIFLMFEYASVFIESLST